MSERLGHANIAITMDTYSHVLPGRWAGHLGVCERGDSNPHGLPHRDLNCLRGVLAGALLGSTRPPGWADAAASSHPVVAHPGVSWRVP